MTDVKKLTIGIPTMGTLPTAFVQSLMSLDKPNCAISMVDRCVTHYARNIISNKFIDGAEEHWGEYLLWIDSDQVFDPESLNEMIRTMNEYPEIDILGALIFKRVYPHTPTFYKVSKFDKDRYEPVLGSAKNSVVECDAIGCGFTLIRRSVFAKMSKPFYKFDNMLGEDLYFCRKAKELGFRIFCHTGVKVGHISDVIIDESDYDSTVKKELEKRSFVLPYWLK